MSFVNSILPYIDSQDAYTSMDPGDFHWPSPAALTIYLFGLTCLLVGIFNITSLYLRPQRILSDFSLNHSSDSSSQTRSSKRTGSPDFTSSTSSTQNNPILAPFYGNNLAAIAMGIYYTLAAYQENEAFFVATVPMRVLSAWVFWGFGGRWRWAALWEGGGAVCTAGALAWERYCDVRLLELGEHS